MASFQHEGVACFYRWMEEGETQGEVTTHEQGKSDQGIEEMLETGLLDPEEWTMQSPVWPRL